jgi:hypothetical protein
MDNEQVPTASDFDLKQYDELKREVEATMLEVRATERNALLAAWAVWTVIGATSSLVPKELAWLPLPLAVLGALRCSALYLSVPARSSYLRMIEATAPHGHDLTGWDTFLRTRRVPLSGLVTTLFWVLFVTASALIPRLY